MDLVENVKLANAYLAKLNVIEELRSAAGCTPIPGLEHVTLPVSPNHANLNEVLLWHGCAAENIPSICDSGLDPRRAGEQVGTMFGYAAYMTPKASKADIYTSFNTRLRATAQRKMLLMRAVLGQSHRATQRMPSALRPPNDLDSVWAPERADGGCVDHLECMVYDAGQAIPIAILTYSHKPGCQCSECPKRRS